MKQLAKLIYLIGGSRLLLHIGMVALTPFFEYIHMWPSDEEMVKVIVFASNKFSLDSFMSSYRSEDDSSNT